MRKLLTLFAFLALAGPARADFVLNNTSLTTSKQDLFPLQPGSNPNNFVTASDYNAATQASLDLRLALTTGSYHGLSQLASDPSARTLYPSSNYFWLKNTQQLHFNYGGVDNLVPFAALTTKGDLIGFTGTLFQRLAVGADGTCLVAASGQATGLQWASCGGVSFPISNGSSTVTLNSGVADGGAAVAYSADTTNALTTDGAVLWRWRSAASDWFTMSRASSARKFTLFGDADGTGSGPLEVKSSSSSAGLLLDATGAGGRKYSLSSAASGIIVLADLTAGANRWQMDANGALAPFSNNTVNLGLPTTNEMAAVYAVLSKARHFAGLSGTPGIAAGTGAGTGPSVSMGTNSTDAAGVLNISTGTAPAGSNATIATITFASAYATAPFVVLTEASNSAAGLAVGARPFVDQTATTTTTFVIKSGGTALGASTAFKWQYVVIQ